MAKLTQAQRDRRSYLERMRRKGEKYELMECYRSPFTSAKTELMLLDALADYQPHTMADIKQVTGLSQSIAHRYLSSLRNDGIIHQPSRAKWQLLHIN